MFTRSSACSLRLPAISTTHCISPHYLLNIPLSAYPHPMVVCSRMAFGIRLWVGLHFDSFFIISRGFYHIQACRYCKKTYIIIGCIFCLLSHVLTLSNFLFEHCGYYGVNIKTCDHLFHVPFGILARKNVGVGVVSTSVI